MRVSTIKYSLEALDVVWEVFSKLGERAESGEGLNLIP